ncbi:SDR family NAD(P)-dependent oxidoreductase [bacterium]|nr:SDR family NAD(P)-dependent oxidoreductase [bacterium]
MNLENKQIVVTGVSRGIGLALCKLLTSKGAVVYGWGRNQPTDFEHKSFHFISCDIQKEDSVNAAAATTLQQSKGRIDGLVNNAGLGYFGYLESQPMHEITTMISTNLLGVIYATRSLLPQMKAQKSGHIINISSIAGIEGYQQVSVYCATKFAITGYSDALYKELRDFGIKVTCVHPGSTQTNFFDNVQSIDAHNNMLQPEEVAANLCFVLEQSGNFLTNSLVFRPLNPRPKKKD